MFMSGSVDASLWKVQVVDIHGTHFYDVAYAHDDDPDTPRTARVGAENVYKDPQPGDAVRVTYLMNVLVEIARR